MTESSLLKKPNIQSQVEELIQFIKIILKVCKNINYESFLNSLYMLRKKLGLFDQFTQFTAC